MRTFVDCARNNEHRRRCSPYEQRFEKLYDDHETQSDQYESQVEQQHQTAHALGVRAKRIGRRHGLDGDARFAGDLGLDRGHFGRGEPVAPVRVVARSRASAPVAPARVMRSAAVERRKRYHIRSAVVNTFFFYNVWI